VLLSKEEQILNSLPDVRIDIQKLRDSGTRFREVLNVVFKEKIPSAGSFF